MEEGMQDRSGSSVEAPGSLILSFSLVIVRREKQQTEQLCKPMLQR